ncbi:hypothetical protein ACFL35_17530 [Candidatus Riflebacteria bacterium]
MSNPRKGHAIFVLFFVMVIGSMCAICYKILFAGTAAAIVSSPDRTVTTVRETPDDNVVAKNNETIDEDAGKETEEEEEEEEEEQTSADEVFKNERPPSPELTKKAVYIEEKSETPSDEEDTEEADAQAENTSSPAETPDENGKDETPAKKEKKSSLDGKQVAMVLPEQMESKPYPKIEKKSSTKDTPSSPVEDDAGERVEPKKDRKRAKIQDDIKKPEPPARKAAPKKEVTFKVPKKKPIKPKKARTGPKKPARQRSRKAKTIKIETIVATPIEIPPEYNWFSTKKIAGIGDIERRPIKEVKPKKDEEIANRKIKERLKLILARLQEKHSRERMQILKIPGKLRISRYLKQIKKTEPMIAVRLPVTRPESEPSPVKDIQSTPEPTTVEKKRVEAIPVTKTPKPVQAKRPSAEKPDRKANYSFGLELNLKPNLPGFQPSKIERQFAPITSFKELENEKKREEDVYFSSLPTKPFQKLDKKAESPANSEQEMLEKLLFAATPPPPDIIEKDKVRKEDRKPGNVDSFFLKSSEKNRLHARDYWLLESVDTTSTKAIEPKEKRATKSPEGRRKAADGKVSAELSEIFYTN